MAIPHVDEHDASMFMHFNCTFVYSVWKELVHILNLYTRILISRNSTRVMSSQHTPFSSSFFLPSAVGRNCTYLFVHRPPLPKPSASIKGKVHKQTGSGHRPRGGINNSCLVRTSTSHSPCYTISYYPTITTRTNYKDHTTCSAVGSAWSCCFTPHRHLTQPSYPAISSPWTPPWTWATPPRPSSCREFATSSCEFCCLLCFCINPPI